MAIPRISRCNLWCALKLFVLLQLQLVSLVNCNFYKVGDLKGWNIPSSANPDVYTQWPKSLKFNVGDIIFFLYPPSQDSVIRVTEESYTSCNLKAPILTMKDGNSQFNITCPGEYYFTSGMLNHCQQSQKLHISVPGNGSCAEAPPSYEPDTSAQSPQADSPSSPTAFGSIPMQETSSSPLSHSSLAFTASVVIGLFFLCFVGL